MRSAKRNIYSKAPIAEFGLLKISRGGLRNSGTNKAKVLIDELS
jgi:hypothetical protein